MRLECPGKVFIAGEYACIEGGPALVGTVEPLFALEVAHTGPGKLPFHPDSPAGRYLAAYARALTGITLSWHDPHPTPIGVGSSSAQFLLSVATIAKLEARPLPSPIEVLELYWKAIDANSGTRPSGVDVVAQWLGGPLLVRNNPFKSEKLPTWRSPAHFILAFTGTKAKTHEHLTALKERGFPRGFEDAFARLGELTLDTAGSWQAGDERSLGRGLNAYQAELTSCGLAPGEFTALIEPIQKWPGVLGCKGSGAQGGDCVLLLVDDIFVDETLVRLKHELGWSPSVIRWSRAGLVDAQNG